MSLKEWFILNYLQEINAFYVGIETNPLSASANVLWHTLMHINNRTGWLREFSVAATVICYKSGLPNSSFKRARKELQEKGYITYTSRGVQAPLYQIHSLVDEFKNKLQQVDETVEEQSLVAPGKDHQLDGDQPGGEIMTKVGAHDRLFARKDIDENKRGEEVFNGSEDRMNSSVRPNEKRGSTTPSTKVTETMEMLQEYFNQNNDEDRIGVTDDFLSFYTYSFYIDNLGDPPKYIDDELYAWAEEMGDTLVFEALKRTIESGHLSWRYTKGILKKWQQKQLHTIEDVQIAEDQYRQQRAVMQQQEQITPIKTEIIPEWFRDRRKGQRDRSRVPN